MLSAGQIYAADSAHQEIRTRLEAVCLGSVSAVLTAFSSGKTTLTIRFRWMTKSLSRSNHY